MKVQLGKKWQETLLEVLPMRKGAKAKEPSDEGATGSDQESAMDEAKSDDAESGAVKEKNCKDEEEKDS